MENSIERKSIRNRILNVVISSLLVLAFVMGGIGIVIVNRLATSASEEIMVSICDAETERLDGKLNLVSHSVEMICEYAKELAELEDTVDAMYLPDYTARIKEMSLAVAEQTEGAMAVYYRFNPENSGTGVGGFFSSRLPGNETFAKENPTNILLYNSSDTEHVGWFYIPKALGKAVWLAPYFNNNLGVLMISYVVPVYFRDGEFAGVIGMDIDFNMIQKSTQGARLYRSGAAELVDLSNHLIYSVDTAGNTYSKKLSTTLYNHITTINKASDILEVANEDGTASLICCKKLSNGMVMYVSVPKNEINSQRRQLIIISASLAFIVLMGAILVILNRTAKIVNPLKKLTEITSRYAAGEWSDNNYICKTGDELQELSEGISKMAMNTQKYINRINGIARTDALTGLKNKTSYVETVEEIKLDRHDEYKNYAVAVMDINLLKKANDEYGHEAGDALIMEAGKYICRTFKKSPVFRIGGDEFATILTGEDFENREACVQSFNENLGYEISEWKGVKLFISLGIAVYEEDASDYDELFRIADDRMYERKKQMKMQRTD